MTIVPIDHLDADHLRNCSRVFVDAGEGAVLVRANRRLPLFMGRTTEPPLSPPDLTVQVPAGTEDPVGTVAAAIEALGFSPH